MSLVLLLFVSMLAGCGPVVPPATEDLLSPGEAFVPLTISLPIHPNAVTNHALLIGQLRAEGRCLFVDTAAGMTLGVAWPAGSRWDAARNVIVVKGAQAPPGQQVAIGGGSADVTRETIGRGPWIVPPRPECLGDRFIFAGSLTLDAPAPSQP